MRASESACGHQNRPLIVIIFTRLRGIVRMDGPEKPIHGVAPNAQGMEMVRMYNINHNRIAEIAFTRHSGDSLTASISL